MSLSIDELKQRRQELQTALTNGAAQLQQIRGAVILLNDLITLQEKSSEKLQASAAALREDVKKVNAFSEIAEKIAEAKTVAEQIEETPPAPAE
jgi:predicted  nucleic acid-binding Zn-ribbon protein